MAIDVSQAGFQLDFVEHSRFGELRPKGIRQIRLQFAKNSRKFFRADILSRKYRPMPLNMVTDQRVYCHVQLIIYNKLVAKFQHLLCTSHYSSTILYA